MGTIIEMEKIVVCRNTGISSLAPFIWIPTRSIGELFAPWKNDLIFENYKHQMYETAFAFYIIVVAVFMPARRDN
jgi:hypothetical protein